MAIVPKFGQNHKTFENSCHSLHEYYKRLNISTPLWHSLVFLMSLMSQKVFKFRGNRDFC